MTRNLLEINTLNLSDDEDEFYTHTQGGQVSYKLFNLRLKLTKLFNLSYYPNLT